MSHRFTRCQLCKLRKAWARNRVNLSCDSQLCRLCRFHCRPRFRYSKAPTTWPRRRRNPQKKGRERGLALVRTGTPGLCLRRCLSIPGAQHRAWRPQVAVPLTVSARALYTAASHVLQIGYFTLPPPCHCQPLRGRSANPNRGVPDTAILEAYRSIHSLPFPLNSLSRSEFYRCARLPHQALPHQFPCLLSFFSH